MANDLQMQKLDRAFDQLDVNHNGQIERDDLLALGSRLALGFGQSPTSTKGKEVIDRYDEVWRVLSQHADVDHDDAVSPAEFRNGMIAAFVEGGKFESTLAPAALAVIMMSDLDNDGHIDAEEFRILQTAFGTSAQDTETAFAALGGSPTSSIPVEDLVQAAREFYTSPDSKARGNQLFGPL